jgi:hypothetical protein
MFVSTGPNDGLGIFGLRQHGLTGLRLSVRSVQPWAAAATILDKPDPPGQAGVNVINLFFVCHLLSGNIS